VLVLLAWLTRASHSDERYLQQAAGRFAESPESCVFPNGVACPHPTRPLTGNLAPRVQSIVSYSMSQIERLCRLRFRSGVVGSRVSLRGQEEGRVGRERKSSAPGGEGIGGGSTSVHITHESERERERVCGCVCVKERMREAEGDSAWQNGNYGPAQRVDTVEGNRRSGPLLGLQARGLSGAWLGLGRGGASGQDSVAIGSPSYSLDDLRRLYFK
jgi:hypothetical protein